jgi:hypothetical protein
MELLEQYLNVIKMYLPREQREDIINELYENLLSEMEDKEAELGRPLNENEQAEILKRHGPPQLMAKRYAPDQPSFTFGRQLIGPESFPIYVKVLWVVLGCMVIVHASLAILGKSPGIGPFIHSMLWTFVSVTLISIFTEYMFKKTRQFWHSPAMHYFPVPKFVPVTGFFVLTACTLWWATIPFFPWLILGTAAGQFDLTATWDAYYLPVLILLLVNTGLRGITLFRPQWMWLLLVARLTIYFIGFSMLYSILKGYPYVSVADTITSNQAIISQARIINDIMYGTILIAGPVYWLINILICGWFLWKDIRYRLKHR